MANWKHYMNSGYSGCTLIANARDHCRDRDVRIFMIPGERDAVGIADGTDAWIAPVSADCFSVNVKRIFDDLDAGLGLPKVQPLTPATGRRRLIVDGVALGEYGVTTEHLPCQNIAPEAPGAPRRRLLAESVMTPSTQPGARRARLQS